MFGKYFAQTFTGSLVGKGAIVHAVWGYCIACARADGTIELNPAVLAAVFGDVTADQVREALAFLAAPDQESRTPEHDGRRIEQIAAYEYLILNYLRFRATKRDDRRKVQNREAQRRRRARIGANRDGDMLARHALDVERASGFEHAADGSVRHESAN